MNLFAQNIPRTRRMQFRQNQLILFVQRRWTNNKKRFRQNFKELIFHKSFNTQIECNFGYATWSFSLGSPKEGKIFETFHLPVLPQNLTLDSKTAFFIRPAETFPLNFRKIEKYSRSSEKYIHTKWFSGQAQGNFENSRKLFFQFPKFMKKNFRRFHWNYSSWRAHCTLDITNWKSSA